MRDNIFPAGKGPESAGPTLTSGRDKHITVRVGFKSAPPSANEGAQPKPRPLHLNPHPAAARVPPQGVPAPNGTNQPTDPTRRRATGTPNAVADRKAPRMLPVAQRPLRWEDPPPRRAGRPHGARPTRPDRYAPLSAELRQRPHEWAVVGEFHGPRTATQPSASNLATAIRVGHTASWSPAGAFESVIRRTGDVTTVYARYLQPES